MATSLDDLGDIERRHRLDSLRSEKDADKQAWAEELFAEIENLTDKKDTAILERKRIQTKLDDADQILTIYIDEFNRRSSTSIDREETEYRLGAALLRHFAISTCGIARWQPTLPRAIKIIDDNLIQVNKAIAYWHARSPDLFSFLETDHY